MFILIGNWLENSSNDFWKYSLQTNSFSIFSIFYLFIWKLRFFWFYWYIHFVLVYIIFVNYSISFVFMIYFFPPWIYCFNCWVTLRFISVFGSLKAVFTDYCWKWSDLTHYRWEYFSLVNWLWFPFLVGVLPLWLSIAS